MGAVSQIPDHDRKMLEAFRLANDLHLDLITGTQAYNIFQRLVSANPPRETVQIGIRRLCLSSVILSLCKWVEYYDLYKSIIPSDIQQHAKQLRNEIDRKGIPDFRNKIVGHILDDDTKRPITMEDVEKKLLSILGPNDINGFMRWVNNPDGNQFPDNVVMVIERVRERIKEINAFTESDLLKA
jgi:hypothetical protein